MTASRSVKQEVRRRVLARRRELVGLSHAIHGRPETAFEEHFAAELLGNALADGGLEVEAPVAGLSTAFTATAGDGPLRVAVCAEYDALPGVGHACGHNLIAASAVAVGLALADAADDLGLSVTVVGTPAEEGHGGKVHMIEAGIFERFHAAMMVHPGPSDVADVRSKAVSHLTIAYEGRSSHAGAFPELGINAADGFVVAQAAIGLLRQHLPADAMVHGIVTDGGQAPNIVPAVASGAWYVRADTIDQLVEVERRVRDCFAAGALATGSSVDISLQGPRYAELRTSSTVLEAFLQNARALGRYADTQGPDGGVSRASTDMGNVSHVVPSIHPYIGIDSLPAVNHQAEFAAHCITRAADDALIDAGLAMAWTCVDLACDAPTRGELLDRATPTAAGG